MSTVEARPWIGPDAYTEELSPLFFGRSAESEEVIRLVSRDVLSVVFGASGLGKTSLLRAGVFPALRSRGLLPVYLRLDHADSAPRLGEQILRALHADALKAGIEAPSRVSGELLWQHFHRRWCRYWSADHHVVTPILVIDQFEEIFTHGQRTPACIARSRELLQELADLVEDRQPKETRAQLEGLAKDAFEAGYDLERAPLRVLISIREDYLAPLEVVRAILPSIVRNRMRVVALKASQAREVVERPGEQWGLLDNFVADGIIEMLSGDGRRGRSTPPPVLGLVPESVAEGPSSPIDPVLLSIFCYELNERRIKAGQPKLSLDLFEGSKDGILTGFYDRAFVGLSPAVRMFVEDRLVSAAGYRDARPVVEALAYPGVAAADLETLVARRLLQFQERQGSPRTVELKHDVFIAVAERSRGARRVLAARAERRRGLLRKILLWSAAIALVAAAVGGAAWYLLFVREAHAYFATFARVRGEPKGIGLLDPKQVAARRTSLHIVRRGLLGHVIRVTSEDYRGRPAPDPSIVPYFINSWDDSGDKPMRSMEVEWHYVYDDAGAVLYEEAFARGDDPGSVAVTDPVWTFVYAPNIEHDAHTGEDVRFGHFIGRTGLPVAHLAGYVEVRFDPKTGFESDVRFQDAAKRPVPGRDNAYGKKWERDAFGRLLRDTSLNANGAPMNDASGNAIAAFERDGLNDPVKQSFFDSSGAPARLSDGESSVYAEYDSAGNRRWEEYRDPAEVPEPGGRGYTRLEFERDEVGRLRTERFRLGKNPTHDVDGCYGYDYRYELELVHEVTCVGPDGRAVNNASGQARFRNVYDAWGDLREEEYFDAAGRPAVQRGYSRVSIVRDERGRPIDRRYFLPSGRRAIVADSGLSGYSRVKTKYADDDRRRTVQYMDADDKPTAGLTECDEAGDPDSCVLVRYNSVDVTEDESGRLVEKRFWGSDGRPVLSNDGYAGYRVTYDARGNESEREFFGVDGAPITSRGGYARLRMESDPVGHVVRGEYLDLAGHPTRDSSGVAGYVDDHDTLGRVTHRTFVGPDGAPARNTDGHAGYRTQFDIAGHEKRVDFLDEQERLQATKGGQATRLDVYDPWGHLTEERYLDVNGAPITVAPRPDDAGGYAVVSRTYDERGHMTDMSFYDGSRKRVRPKGDMGNTSACASITNEYDDAGRKQAMNCWDVDGKAAPSAEGWVRVEFTRDPAGRITRMDYFGHDRSCALAQKIHTTLRELDPFGNIERVTYLGCDGKRTLSKDGVAELRQVYTDGVVTEVSYFGVDPEERVKGPERYHREVLGYDPIGRPSRFEYFGPSGPVLIDGFRAELITYDTKDRVVARDYLGLDGRPSHKPDHYARETVLYTDDGRESEVRYFDEAERPTASPEGCATRKITYGLSGADTTETRTCLSTQGTSTLGSFKDSGDVYAREVIERNPQNRVVARSYFGFSGEPHPQDDGCAARRYEYDAWGNPTNVECFRRPWLKGLTSGGYHALHEEYDARGQSLFQETLDVQGNLVRGSSGFARQTFEYDARGNEIARSYFDEKRNKMIVDGAWRLEQEYDANGNRVVSRRLDAGGRVLLEVRSEFDLAGREIRETYFDEHNNPIVSTSPDKTECGEWLVAYDAKGIPRTTCHARVPDPSPGVTGR